MNSANKPTKGSSKSFQKKSSSHELVETIVKYINDLDNLAKYEIRKMVKDSGELGEFLKNTRLQTNQIRKFLDAINRLKVILNRDKVTFSDIEPEVVLLQPKLAYAAARQRAAKPLNDVISAAIDKVKNIEDFTRLVQFVESIVAYHKAAGGQ